MEGRPERDHDPSIAALRVGYQSNEIKKNKKNRGQKVSRRGREENSFRTETVASWSVARLNPWKGEGRKEGQVHAARGTVL